MNLYEKATNVADEILSAGLFSGCALRQTNQHRAGSLNLMHESMRKALDDVFHHDSAYETQHGLGESRLVKTARLVEQLRFAVNFGLFKDLREPPYPLDTTPERRTQERLIEARVADVLRMADGLAGPDPRNAIEKIRDHLLDAERLWGELPRQDQDELTERQNVNEDTSLRHCLRWGAQHAEEMVDLQQHMGATPA